MKKHFFKGMAHLAAFAMVAMVTLVSCSDDPEPDPEPTVSNGYYIQGGGTALSELISNGKMSVAKNEVNQENLSSLLELYISVSAGTEGFNIVQVISGEETILGPGSDFAEVAGDDLDGDEPTLGLWRGSYVASETVFTVSEDGLYHVVIDNSTELIVIAKVEWGLIGAATPNGWSGSTQLGAPAFDLNSMEFSSTNVVMTAGEFKYRYSNGWKVILTDEIKVNTNFGGSVAALEAGGANINNEEAGVFTATVKWELGTGTTATLTKTGDTPPPDYSDHNLGFIGDAVWTAADTAFGWGATYEKITPAVDGTNYTWSWSGVDVRNTGSFKIRQGDDWNGLNLGYNDVTLAGTSADNFESTDDGNFKPVADGVFEFVLTVDAAVGDFTFTVDPTTK